MVRQNCINYVCNSLPMKFFYALLAGLASCGLSATTYTGNPGNFPSFLSSLAPGDTLLLQNGNYTNALTLNNVNGAVGNPIVIIGASQNGVIFLGNACCNTVSITHCSYLTLKNFTINGQNIIGIDAVKAEGTLGNWAHHIILEDLRIINYGADQQNVGISTKCTVWDWVIRRNIIDFAGTGMYLGNSNGDSPFVNGIIEGNVVKNTVGYNIEIKQENDSLRTISGMTLSGKTVIRYNVFTKELNASTGGNARPCVLVDHYPGTGVGTSDYYEIYNNFFYENPVEALFQGTGNMILYNNIFVNHQSGGWGVEIRDHNGFQSRDVKVFHNTIVVNSGTGLHFYNCDINYQQYAVANAVFGTPAISANTTITNTDNVSGTYIGAGTMLNAPFASVNSLDCYPQSGQCTGTLTSNTLFNTCDNYANDFNNAGYNWIYRGAYSGSGTNGGWVLQIDTMPMPGTGPSGINWHAQNEIKLFPNPSNGEFLIETEKGRIEIYNLEGKSVLFEETKTGMTKINSGGLPNGIYFLKYYSGNKIVRQKLIIQH